MIYKTDLVNRAAKQIQLFLTWSVFMIRLSPRLSKAARSLIGWQQDDLSTKSGVSKSTIGAFESKGEDGRLTTMNHKAIVEAFEAAGVLFLASGETADGGPGVRLREVDTRAGNHPKPVGPATDAVDAMDKAIRRDRKRRR